MKRQCSHLHVEHSKPAQVREGMRMRGHLQKAIRGTPWARRMVSQIRHENDHSHLILHFRTPLAMLLTAATSMKNINRIVAHTAANAVCRVTMESDPVKQGGKIYDPRIRWHVNPADRRAKRIRRNVTDRFVTHVWHDQYARAVLGNLTTDQSDLMQQAFADSTMHEQAIHRLLCHLVRRGLLATRDGILDLDWLYDAERRQQAKDGLFGFMTRRRALAILDETGMLIRTPGHQRQDVWPRMESLTGQSGHLVLDLLSRVVGQDIDALKGSCRESEITYYRHLIMYVFHMTSNRTLHQISRQLGRSDHTTSRNAIQQIRAYSERWQGHRAIVDLLCDIVDSLGVCMVKYRKLNVDEGFSIHETPAGAHYMTLDAEAVR